MCHAAPTSGSRPLQRSTFSAVPGAAAAARQPHPGASPAASASRHGVADASPALLRSKLLPLLAAPPSRPTVRCTPHPATSLTSWSWTSPAAPSTSACAPRKCGRVPGWRQCTTRCPRRRSASTSPSTRSGAACATVPTTAGGAALLRGDGRVWRRCRNAWQAPWQHPTARWPLGSIPPARASAPHGPAPPPPSLLAPAATRTEFASALAAGRAAIAPCCRMPRAWRARAARCPALTTTARAGRSASAMPRARSAGKCCCEAEGGRQAVGAGEGPAPGLHQAAACLAPAAAAGSPLLQPSLQQPNMCASVATLPRCSFGDDCAGFECDASFRRRGSDAACVQDECQKVGRPAGVWARVPARSTQSKRTPLGSEL